MNFSYVSYSAIGKLTSRSLGMVVFMFIFSSAAIVTFILPPSYSSTARIRVTGGTNLNTEVAVIQSDKILDPVIEHLQLNEKWQKTYEMPEPMHTGMSRAMLRKMIDIRIESGTTLADITVFSDSPKEAAEIANAVAEQYQDRNKALTNMLVLLVDKAVERPIPVRPNKPLDLCLGALFGIISGTTVSWVTSFLFSRLGPKQPPQSPSTPTVPQIKVH